MFNLENAIKTWKRTLKQSPAFEEGQLKEMETHLRDEIDSYIENGYSEEEAFKKAVSKFGKPEQVGDEVYKTKTIKKDATPPWKKKFWITGMLPNYFKIALRNIYANKLQSTINIVGLAIGLACCMLIYLFVQHQLTFDTFHEDSENIYLLTYREIDRPGARYFSTTSPPMGPSIQKDFPEVKHAVRLRDSQNNIFTYRDRQFFEENIFYADSAFFDLFTFQFARGNPETALDQPNSVVLTSESAQKYFPDENPMGKELVMDGNIILTVTGVLNDIPANTHLPLSLVISFETFRVPSGYPVTLESWEWVSFHTYLELKPGADPDRLEEKLPDFLQKYRNEEMADRGRLLLQPVTDIYLSETPRNDVMKYGNYAYVKGLAAIAILILIIAGFNFMNISTAQSLKRGKEAGIRKALGGNRTSLMRQFLGESVIKSLISLSLALLIANMASGYFANLLGFQIDYNPALFMATGLTFLTVSIVVGLGAGLYPAFAISSFKAGEVLKGKLTTGRTSQYVRNGLMTLQFAISIGLIIGSIAVTDQINFLQEKELGFDKEQTIALKVVREQFEDRYRTIKQKLETNSNVEQVTAGDLFAGGHGSVPIFPEGFEDEEGYPMNIFGVKYGFFETLDIQLKEGRSFSRSFSTDSAQGVILNQAAVDALEWVNPIGKEIQISNIVTDGKVIGVTENFHFASLHNRIQPLAMYIPRANLENILVKVKPGNLGEILTSLRSDWESVAPDMPFEYTFLDDSINQMYRSEEQFADIVMLFTFLSIFIACIGLYGLVSINLQYRTKEIGIRKVLGASLGSIIGVISKPYLIFIIISNLIAWPIAWLFLNDWLKEFAFSISLGVWIFILAGLGTTIIAFFTITGRVVKSATANPVESLRSE